MKLFSLDSPFGRVVSMIADLVILNLLFLFSCMPVLTIGAACGALYDTVNAMLMGECATVSRHYFDGFRKCFKRGTVLFAISAVALIVVFLDLMLALGLDSVMGLMCTGVITASGVLVLGVQALLPMMLCRESEMPVKQLIKEGFLTAMKGTWRTVAAIVLNMLPFLLFLFLPALFLRSWMFWFLMGFSMLAYVNNWLLLKVVDPESWEQLRPAASRR